MKERADIAGGKVEFISGKGQGTEVRLIIPISQEN
jgi:signal transduction histidine kinase